MLNSWKEECAHNTRPRVPEAPPEVTALFRQLWSEAFRSADTFAAAERAQHAKEKLALDKNVSEMSLEIGRLEQALTTLQAEHEGVQKTLQAKNEELRQSELERVRVDTSYKTTNDELLSLRESVARVQEQLPEWVARATRAETRLEEIRNRRETSERKK